MSLRRIYFSGIAHTAQPPCLSLLRRIGKGHGNRAVLVWDRDVRVHFSVLSRGKPLLFGEQSGEVMHIVVPHAARNLANGKQRIAQEHSRLDHADLQQALERADAPIAGKAAAEMRRAEAEVVGETVQREGIAVMVIEITADSCG